MTAGRQFLHYLEMQGIDLAGATAGHEEAFLTHKLNSPRRRDGREPSNLSAWRCSYTSGLHMLMRLAQGKWPPEKEPTSPEEVFRQALCDAYAQWLSDVRGLAANTVRTRRAEAQRFLESLDEKGGDRLPCPDHRCRPRSLCHEPGSATSGGSHANVW